MDVETHLANIGGLGYEGDLSDPDDFLDHLSAWGFRRVDLIAGGVPCQRRDRRADHGVDVDTFSVNISHTVQGVVTGKPLSLGGSLGRFRRPRAASRISPGPCGTAIRAQLRGAPTSSRWTTFQPAKVAQFSTGLDNAPSPD